MKRVWMGGGVGAPGVWVGLLLAFAAGCAPEESPEIAPQVDVPEAPGLRTLEADTVVGWTGPGGEPFEVSPRTPGDRTHLTARMGQRNFSLQARLSGRTLVQYPCTSCHEGVVEMADRVEDAHRNIQPLHPSSTGAACSTCHLRDSVQRLSIAAGGSTTMDHSYQLCAQCHFSTLESWAGGGHGKRFEGWAGRRVVMNCTDCHDPHNPALEPRNPYPGPTLPGAGGKR
ncbi:MAG: hypothetical protein WD960_10070 [Gemmatimonadota bacterium]